jgi:3-phosphoshikimate 1-carboxyvinyltransferase
MPNALPPAYAIVPPNRPLSGRVSPPGSKSITNRALLLAALAKGTSRLTGALKSKDTVLMAKALRAMGVEITEPDATSFLVTSLGRLTAPAAPLSLGNAGTATRFLTAAVATIDGTVIVDGDEDMRLRPIRSLVDALNQLGIDAESPTGCPPVTIRGTGRFGKGRVEIDASLSSQYVSALLMAAPFGDGPIEIALAGKDIGARGYVDLTIAAMRAFGADVTEDGEGAWLVQPTGYKATDFHIEPDASAATYLWGIEALTGGKIDLGVSAVAFTQPDAAAQAIIASFPNMPEIIDGSQMQDAVPTMAVVAAFNNRPVRFVGIANLRVKETDRIRAVANELNRILPGLATEEGDDLIVASDPALASQLSGRNSRIKIETYHDHRIAMSFALAGLLVSNIVILDPACTGKTYPDYWTMLAGLGVELQPDG